MHRKGVLTTVLSDAEGPQLDRSTIILMPSARLFAGHEGALVHAKQQLCSAQRKEFEYLQGRLDAYSM